MDESPLPPLPLKNGLPSCGMVRGLGCFVEPSGLGPASAGGEGIPGAGGGERRIHSANIMNE